MKRAAAGLLLALAGAAPAGAETLVVTLSTAEIRINSNFTGAGITVFGAIERDAATVSRPEEYDIVVIMRGPPQRVITRRKDRLLGLWVNRAAATFADVPSFYAAHASREIDEISIPAVLERHQIGLASLAFSPARDDAVAQRQFPDFRQAFIRLKVEESLYTEAIGAIDMPGANIFQTTIDIPANIPVGTYAVAVYLFSGAGLLAHSERTLHITKTGFEQLMFDVSREQPLVYGLAVIAGALGIGWLAGIAFRRD